MSDRWIDTRVETPQDSGALGAGEVRMTRLADVGAPLERALESLHQMGTDLLANADITSLVDAAIADLRWNDPVAFSVWSAHAIRVMTAQALADGGNTVDLTGHTEIHRVVVPIGEPGAEAEPFRVLASLDPIAIGHGDADHR